MRGARRTAMIALGLVASVACSTMTRGPATSPLDGTAWTLASLADRPPVADSSVTMTFAAEERVSGSSGCNRYTSSYMMDGTRMRFGPAAATRMACGDEAVMAQEHAYFRALESVATVHRDGDRLELRSDDGVLVMTLVRTAGP